MIIKLVTKINKEKPMICSGAKPKGIRSKRKVASRVPRPDIEIGRSVTKLAMVIETAK